MKVAFYRAWPHGEPLDKLISLWTFGPYSHCELVFTDGTAFSSSYRDGGVRFKKIEFLPNRWDLLVIPGPPQSFSLFDGMLWDWCNQHEGAGYDLLGILSHGLQSSGKWYCSEICAMALRQFGFYYGRTNVVPNKLYHLLRSTGFHPADGGSRN